MIEPGSGLRRALARGLISFVLCLAGAVVCLAEPQTFPVRPVRIVVPAAAGGALDTISRLMAQTASKIWNQTVFVENKPGANWIIGMDAVAKSAPDGYTLLFVASSGLTINPYVFPNMPLDPLHDLVPVTTATLTPYVLLANRSLPAKTLPEFIAYLKENPKKLNHASNSSSTMLVSELFRSQANVDYVDINYRGASNAIAATIAGTTQFCFVDLGSGSFAIDQGTLNALGVTSRTRSKMRPEIPTLAEQGLPGYAVDSSTLLLAPAKTPPEVLATLNSAFTQALKSPEVNAKLTAMGQVVAANGADETMRNLTSEAEQWKKLIEERHIQFGQ